MDSNPIPPPPGQGPSVNPFGAYQPQIEDLRAGFGIRPGAHLLDTLFASLLIIGITAILAPLNLPVPEVLIDAQNSLEDLFGMLSLSSDDESLISQVVVSSSYAGAIGSVLYMLIEGFTGASLGKRILQLTVAHAAGRAGNQSLFLFRMFVKTSDRILHLLAILPFFTIFSGAVDSAGSTIGFVLFIGCFLVLGRNRQALHDMVVKTAVFKTHDVKY